MTAAILPPLLLAPYYVGKPWGGRRLADELGRTDLPAGPVGESWEVFDLPAADGTRRGSRVDGGPHDGRLLADVLGAPVPLLLKVLDAREDLSIQVHPDGPGGKEEAWVALAEGGSVACAAPGATFESGLAPGQWLAHLECTAQHAGCLDAARPPTITHVPAGTVHAILGGSLLLEIQNPVDLTWRLDDHGRVGLDGRPRDLHLAEAASLLAQPTPSRATLGAGGWSLTGERFALQVVRSGEERAPRAQAAFFTQAGTVAFGDGERLAVPGGRTVWLAGPVHALASDGWIVTAEAR